MAVGRNFLVQQEFRIVRVIDVSPTGKVILDYRTGGGI